MYATNSTQSTIDIEELLSYLTSTKLVETQWRGTHHALILHWCDQLRRYEGLINNKDISLHTSKWLCFRMQYLRSLHYIVSRHKKHTPLLIESLPSHIATIRHYSCLLLLLKMRRLVFPLTGSNVQFRLMTNLSLLMVMILPST